MTRQETVDEGFRYARAFANYNKKEKVEAVDRLIGQYTELLKFERAQLGSLSCRSAEEAKTLIPSLDSKMDDETLQGLHDMLESLGGD